MEMKTEEIKVGYNPRSDFGNLTELVASIREQGILEPLLITKDKELIAGERRLRAAKELRLKTVPVVILEKGVDVNEIKLVENIQRKNFNPVEEALAFKKYLDGTGHDKEYLAMKIGKKKDYILRRIQLLDLSDDAGKALIKKDIQIGHAVVLAKFGKDKQAKMLKRIRDEGVSANDIDDVLRWEEASQDLTKAPFCKKDCNNCNFNGGEQTLLIDNGSVKGLCLKPSCYIKKVNNWAKQNIKEMKEQGISILKQEEIDQIRGAKLISEWDHEYKQVEKRLSKEPDTYVVTFENSRYSPIPEKKIYQIKNRNKAKKKGEITKEDLEQKQVRSKEILKQRIWKYKFELLKKAMKGILSSEETICLINLWKLGQAQYKDYNRVKIINDKEAVSFKKDDILKRFKETAELITEEMFWDIKVLENLAIREGYNYNRDYELDKEFLKLHTKGQLISLSKEFKINPGKPNKKTELIDTILKGWKKGQVPGILDKSIK